MNTYWEMVWSDADIQEYLLYIKKYLDSDWSFIKLFHEYGVNYVCDAACGYGAFSTLLSVNGFRTVGFDVAQTSVDLTKKVLKQFDIMTDEYIVSDITDILFPTEVFDGVVAHAVIDHLRYQDAQEAILELLRILKPGGLLYLSFDPLEEEDLALKHERLGDGSFLYRSPGRDGLLFHYYEDIDIETLLKDMSIIYRGKNNRNEREVIIKKEGTIRNGST
jgi:SAM-dependent methyltransferase